ncbi:hypothetical protein CYLTODRAFT_410381 [Cylindrobasidium torrendii FP15055 ss-10]|uniref:F-box domain-containing protein n=1 Tax=Cylindrobasidium torrendii FP15055 ss-10 TaxID=1314674 RepID=A0A0D7BFT5_9AGAR|nr:hypothetical protein CYLTODRAFT_410381 [Cylindrobasidium torrendii FP15055 ss-10]
MDPEDALLTTAPTSPFDSDLDVDSLDGIDLDLLDEAMERVNASGVRPIERRPPLEVMRVKTEDVQCDSPLDEIDPSSLDDALERVKVESGDSDPLATSRRVASISTTDIVVKTEEVAEEIPRVKMEKSTDQPSVKTEDVPDALVRIKTEDVSNTPAKVKTERIVPDAVIKTEMKDEPTNSKPVELGPIFKRLWDIEPGHGQDPDSKDEFASDAGSDSSDWDNSWDDEWDSDVVAAYDRAHGPQTFFDLSKLPHDILLEILRYLDPLALFNLAQTFPFIEKMLNARTATAGGLRGRARVNISDMPPPFNGMSEEDWVRLNFVFRCDFCTGTPRTMDERDALRRVSEACGWESNALAHLEERLLVPAHTEYVPEQDELLGTRLERRNLVLDQHVKELEKKLLAVPPEARELALEGCIQDLGEILAHAKKTIMWRDEYMQDQEDELEKIVAKNLFALGYAKEVLHSRTRGPYRNIVEEVINSSMYLYTRGMIPSYGKICWERVARGAIRIAKDMRKELRGE